MVRKQKTQGGFTLIELLAVTGVMVILTSVILVNNAKFGGVVTLRNLAYDIALTIRQTQTYGISVRKFGSGAGSFGSGYGLHILESSPTQYIMFADINSDGIYNGASELVEQFTIGRGFGISDLCVTPAVGSETCNQTRLDMVFRRPEPDAEIRNAAGPTLYQRGKIVILSPRGDSAAVLIEATGQISLEQ